MTDAAADKRVLILDGNQRSALAATRSLGRRGLTVLVGDTTARTLAGSSRYCNERVVYPSPHADGPAFVETLKRVISRRRVDVVLPMSDVATRLVTEHRSELGAVRIPCPPPETFDAVTDKWELYVRARELGIAVPRTALVRSREDLTPATAGMAFPLVVKPRLSWVMSGGRWTAAPVQYASSAGELEEIAGRGGLENNPILLQEYVAGRGQGVFSLYAQGKAITFFAHRRLREKPPSGGVSVLSESVSIDPRLREATERLLDSVGWHGVAMAEFKVTPEGTPYLIEINGRFWGSLQLAIDSGVDFPWLLYRVALGEEVAAVEHYAIGRRNLWLLGDLDHLYLRLKGPGGLREKWRAVGKFLRMFEGGTRHEVNRWDDMKPFLHEMACYLGVSHTC